MPPQILAELPGPPADHGLFGTTAEADAAFITSIEMTASRIRLFAKDCFIILLVNFRHQVETFCEFWIGPVVLRYSCHFEVKCKKRAAMTFAIAAREISKEH